MARSAAIALFFLLCLLQPVWYLWLAPPASLPAWLALSLALIPLAPVMVLLALGRPSALFWAGVVSLLYFCHGVMEGWTVPATRGLGLFEASIAFALVCAVGADGLHRRRAARAAAGAPPPRS
ncbi:DUF2069 domain-containing protein [Pseudomarimonas salicorniae]|uniref:DUF2069 domain-containing protein n=1 Tax=Pseudomarimonas salicorniae TaxID=2933270 RepID=A0ABT0GJW3_9GAMM|nr:DUF2069 domain-containing protein [Lysobacter sp. CAU 1642]MCK7594327.1 DUF2069 domain-containing protein [Lysobacter sp. CAU 1642]